jgi:hypothetical protein
MIFFVKSYRASLHSLYKESNIATEMERSTKQPEKRFLENLKNNHLWTYRNSLRTEIVVKANLVKKIEKISNNRKIVLKIVFSPNSERHFLKYFFVQCFPLFCNICNLRHYLTKQSQNSVKTLIFSQKFVFLRDFFGFLKFEPCKQRYGLQLSGAFRNYTYKRIMYSTIPSM